MSDDLALADMNRAVAGAEAIVAGIGDGQWTAPTPCTNVDVRALVNHLVTGNLHFAALVNGTAPPDGDADHLGDDPRGAFRRAAAALCGALARPGVLSSEYALPFGTVQGVGLAQIRIIEHLGHGWDLARGSGQPADFPADVCERALAAARRHLAARPQGPHSPFGPVVEVPDGAPAIDRLAGFLGRHV